MLLSICAPGSRIVEACYFRREYLPCPIRVGVRTPEGSTRSLVLRVARHGDVGQEARLLPILAGVGLPVPAVLAGPAPDPDVPTHPDVAVYSLMPGIDLLQLSQQSAQDCRLAANLVLEGARRLASLTRTLRATAQAGFVHTVTLHDQLQAVVSRGGPWLHGRQFGAAAEALHRVLDDMPDQTVFTCGDYQPGNFLTDGACVTGFLDFELACYQDFLFGFAKYPIYDIHPLNKSGLVSFVLEKERIPRREFDIRLALGCLITLQREIPVSGGDAEYRDHVLGLLAAACGSF
jgi:hypothetical protein